MPVTDPNRLSSAKRALLERQLHGGLAPWHDAGTIRPRGDDGPAPLSYGQRQIWFLSQLGAGSAAYNETLAVLCPPTIDPGALERAFNEVLRRHQAWRTVFRVVDGEPVQVVLPPATHRLRQIDLTHLPVEEGAAEATRLAGQDAQAPFDLEKGPLWRATLVRLGDGDHRLYLTLFHAIFDGVSVYQVLLPELRSLHDALVEGRDPSLPELPIQYADFAAWQREYVKGPAVRAQLDYWRKQLAELPSLELPTDRPRPATQSFRGSCRPIALPQQLVEDLKRLCREEGVTLFMVALAAFQLLLHFSSGQEDLVMGTVTTSRKRPELDGLMGYFLNPVVLRTDLSGQPSFRELLRRVREVTLAAFAHDDVPFEQVVQALLPRRDLGRNPLFQVLLTLEPHTANAPSGWDLTTQLGVDDGTSKFDLHVELEDRSDGLVGRFLYSTDLFDAETIDRTAGRFQDLLGAVAARPDLRLPELALRAPAARVPSQEERRRMVVEWNRTAVGTPAVGIARRFEEVAARWPEREAVSCGGRRLSYAELDRRANRLAHRLRSLGAGREALVGVCLDRSLDMVVALLGILKAGAAYVPLDPHYPQRRLALLLEDTGAGVVVTGEGCWPWSSGDGETRESEASLAPTGVRPIHLDDEEESDFPQTPPEAGAGAADLAYVLYTSGSTGDPKGVMVEQRSVLRLVCPATYAELGAEAVLLQLAPLAFDASTFEIWGALLNGGRLVVAPPGVLSARELGELVEREGVNTLWLTGGLFNQVVEAGMPGLRGLAQLLTGGETLSPDHCRRAMQLLPETRLINGYGPTEATTFTCCHPISARDLEEGSIPIGRPIGNTSVYILDELGEPVPVGVTGELHVGGMGVARGYLRKPELTRERFPRDPFGAGDGHLYRTGDLARYRPDGGIEFLGRRDRQVKIRGFRIELGEIEAALAAHPRVAEAVVEAPDQGGRGRRLVAYLVPRGGEAPAIAELAGFLQERLPGHMLPAAYVSLESLPLNANGKVDRRALPEAMLPQDLDREFRAEPDRARHGASRERPRSRTESELAAMWARLLGLEEVGVNQSFFALGGQSLLAVSLMSDIERRFGRPLPLAAIFGEGATVAGLARLLEEPLAPAAASPLVSPIRLTGSRPPLFVVEPDRGPLMALRHFLPFLDERQPVVALLPWTEGGRFHRETSIEALAEELVEAMRTRQPRGPYRLAGYSLGGLLAYQMAARLREGGEEVAFLGLIDTMTPELGLRHVEPFMSLPTRVRRLLMTTPTSWPAMLWGAAQREAWLRAPVLAVVPDAGGARLAPTGPGEFDSEGGVALVSRYRMPVCDVPITVFSSRWQQRWVRDRTLGWSRAHPGQVDVEVVPGDHRTMLLQPHVSDLAARFARRLEEAVGGAVSPEKALATCRVSVVMPARNEAANLPHVLPRVPRWIYELLLVDGQSSDGTVEVARRLWPEVRVVHQEGRGKGQALRQGFDAATGDVIVMLDSDGSTDPAEIPLYVGALLGGAGFVKGSRYIQGGGSTDLSLLRSLGNLVLTLLTRLLFRSSFSDLCYGYMAFWRRLLPVLEPQARGFEIEAQLCLRALARGLKVYEVPSFERVRITGRSSLRALPDGWRVLKTIFRERLDGRISARAERSLERLL